jgi:hypothetical protein
MSTVVQEHVHHAVAVAVQNNRFLAHSPKDKITGRRDLALVPNEQPHTRKNPL